MREIKRISPTSSCGCSKKMMYLQLNFPLKPEYLQVFNEQGGYRGKKSYDTRGIFYIESDAAIVFGPYHSNRLQVRCKGKGCSEDLDKIETILKEM